MDLGDVFDAADAFLDSMDSSGYDLPEPRQSEKKRAVLLVEPEVNEFGRVTEWYHCGIRNTGSVCRCCGEYRRDRTIVAEPDFLEKATVPYWKCPDCGTRTTGAVCEQCRQPRPKKFSNEKPKPSLRKRVYYWFVRRPWAFAAAWAIFLIMLFAVLWFIEK